MQNGMINDYPGHNRRPALYCNDDGWVFVKKDDKDPRYPNTNRRIRDSFSNAPGAWCFRDQRCMYDPGQSATDKDMCHPTSYAFTIPVYSMITMCPFMFTALKKQVNPRMVQLHTTLNSPDLDTYSVTIVHEL